MKELIFNNDNLKDTDINAVVTRVKVLMLNSKNELLLGYCEGIYQFPGGHVEEGESLNQTVKREIKEETGIELNTENLVPFYCIKHYTKNYNDTRINKLSQLYYFFIKTDEKINLDNIKYTEHEKSGGYKLEYINIDNLKNVLNENIPNNIHNKTIVKEMLAVLNASGIYEDFSTINYIERIPTVEEFNMLTEAVGWGKRENEIVREALNNTLYSLCVYDKENLVGYGRIIGDKTIFLYIHDVMVVPEYQGKGIGKGIMNELLNQVEEFKKVNPNIRTYLGASKGKEDFYEKFGFIKRPNEELGAGMILF